MVFHEFDTGCVPGCTVLDCSCTRVEYWSSSTIRAAESNAWEVRFDDGLTGGNLKGAIASVRAVRGGS